ncbi:MAG: SRPBCC family protein [Propionibacteriaceae bacterium]|nr:SRPBCC family protein [Propionibacteriaceae bacterium]
MSTVIRHTAASPDEVWAVLADGWSYPGWVVGASRVRDVSLRWPEVGALIHHSVGVWPVVLDDETEVMVSEPAKRLRLEARTRPVMMAAIEFELEEADGGGTLVTMHESVTAGPGRFIPDRVAQALFKRRNDEVLLRLCLIAERQDAPAPDERP